MKNTIFALFLTFLIAITFNSSVASAATDIQTRYFVKSLNPFIKNSFNARHSFPNGFTADLSDWQVRVTKIFGIEIEPVQTLFVLPDEPARTPPKESGTVLKGGKVQRYLPGDQTPWAIEEIYQDSQILKTSGGKGVKVAVLDTGILSAHPDLFSRVKGCKDFTGARGILDGKCDDKNGHGTHVAGIIAADGGADGLGIYGVAPEADLIIYKVCSPTGMCYADDIAAAIRLSADIGANIVNMSLGSDSPIPLIADALSYADEKGVFVAAAAGNDGPYFGSIDYPAAYQSVISVGAFDRFLNVAEWSSQGINTTTEPYVKNEKDIEFAMPGVNVESTWKNGGYAILSGTSMASPFLSGLAARYWQEFAEKPAEATRNRLHDVARDISVFGDDNASGWGFARVVSFP